MTHTQLQSFLAIARYRSFTAAALPPLLTSCIFRSLPYPSR